MSAEPVPSRQEPPPDDKAKKAEEDPKKKNDNEEDQSPLVVPNPDQSFISCDWDHLYEMLQDRNAAILEEKFGGADNLVRNIVQSNKEDGIDVATYDRRLAQFGPNILKKKEPVTFLEFIVDAFSDRVVQILTVAAIVSIILGVTVPNPHTGVVEYSTGWIEGLAICISVIVVVLTGSINNYQKAKKFEEMEKEQALKNLQVKRGGAEITILSDALTVGDLVHIEYGMELVMDGIVVDANDLKLNESSLTGEPDLVHKKPGMFVISGTTVEEGEGHVIVLAVGMRTQQGRSKQSLDQEVQDTPLQEHLEELADQIGYVGFAGAFILISALCIKEGILVSTQGKVLSGINFLNFILICITLIAVAIPEGLPLAVTIALAYSMKAMMQDNCMVRVLAACETMGAATAICSDKTGTLTTNEMTLVQALIAEEEVVLRGYEITPRPGATETDRNNIVMNTKPAVLTIFCESLAINSTARQTVRDGKQIWVGNKTDQGMIRFIQSMKYDYVAIRERYEGATRQYPFNSTKKRMTTLVREKDDAKTITAHIKGASEVILESSHKYMNKNGDILPITAELRANWNAIILDMATQGNRTIAISRQAPLNIDAAACAEDGFPPEEPELDDIVFLGVCGIQDPIRQEVPFAVQRCHDAGLVVRMVTGDNIHTAISISKKCNVYHADGFDMALEGPVFRRMAKDNRQEVLDLLPRLKILARSSPADKYLLVELLQELGEVVGVTGDGTNDAPALKLANVGLAMNDGTDIAKAASSMVLLDNNFASVANAIKWGRCVNDNIKRFLQFQLSINCAGVLLTIIGALASPTSKEPLGPVQLLWLNLIMDTLAALSLATESPHDGLMDYEPVYKEAPIITNKMRVFIVIHGAFQFAMIMAIQFVGHEWFRSIDEPGSCDRTFTSGLVNITKLVNNVNVTTPELRYEPQYYSCKVSCEKHGGLWKNPLCQQGRKHSTMIFNIFIWFQIFNVINARKLMGEVNPLEGVIDRSRNLIIIFTVIAGLQAIAVELLGEFIETVGLTGMEWLYCILFGMCELVLGVIVRLVQHAVQNSTPESVIAKKERLVALRETCHSLTVTTEPAASAEPTH